MSNQIPDAVLSSLARGPVYEGDSKTREGVNVQRLGPLTSSIAGELLLLRARLAYIVSNGGAWEKRVALGELDEEATAP